METKVYLKDLNVVIERNGAILSFIPTRLFAIEPEEEHVILEGKGKTFSVKYVDLRGDADQSFTKQEAIDYLSPLVGFNTASGGSGASGGASKRIGEFVYAKSGKTPSNGYLEVLPGPITNAALTYPLWAAMYPEFVQGNDIVFPADVDGMFLRNLGGEAGAEGIFQNHEIQAHGHGYLAPPVNQFTRNGTNSNISRRGQNRSIQTSSTGGTETRPKNRAYQLYTIVDTY